jgi:hypothetical protein
MKVEDYIIEATEMVAAWDLPESELSQAIQDQAQLMAGLDNYSNDEYSPIHH